MDKYDPNHISVWYKLSQYRKYMKSSKGAYEWESYSKAIAIGILLYACIVGVLRWGINGA